MVSEGGRERELGREGDGGRKGGREGDGGRGREGELMMFCS